MNVSNSDKQRQKIKSESGFIAALDQSGGSTPKALKLYGIKEGSWKNDDEMFKIVHDMRDFLWNVKNVVPFLKIDKGLADEKDGVQLMKPIPGLDALLTKAKSKNIFGTKMRSVIKQANPKGVAAIVKQQFELGRQIVATGLVPIIEPEVDIHCPDKAKAEQLLKAEILKELNKLKPDQLVMLKLTLPEQDNFYMDCIKHPNVLKVVALSGGYSREEANKKLARNNRMVASFSRALVEGLTAQQSDKDFNAALDASIESTYQASKT
jgi:fructose-bisphosphate aldolase class I